MTPILWSFVAIWMFAVINLAKIMKFKNKKYKQIKGNKKPRLYEVPHLKRKRHTFH